MRAFSHERLTLKKSVCREEGGGGNFVQGQF